MFLIKRGHEAFRTTFLKLFVTGKVCLFDFYKNILLSYDLYIKRQRSCVCLTGNMQYFIALYQNRPHSDVSKGKGKASFDSGWRNKKQSGNIISHIRSCQTFGFIWFYGLIPFFILQRRKVTNMLGFQTMVPKYFSHALNLCCVYTNKFNK